MYNLFQRITMYATGHTLTCCSHFLTPFESFLISSRRANKKQKQSFLCATSRKSEEILASTAYLLLFAPFEDLCFFEGKRCSARGGELCKTE